MGALDDRSNVRSLIRRFWWVGLIVLFVLLLLCVVGASPNALARVFNPPPPEEESTQAPTDSVTQPPATEEATDSPTDPPTDEPTDPPTDEATPLVTDPPPQVTEVGTEAACHCEGVDWVCPTGVSYNSVECGGSGLCICFPDKTLVCPDGTFAAFNPACGVGGGGQQCSRTEYCGDRTCQPWCGEDPRSCPMDC